MIEIFITLNIFILTPFLFLMLGFFMNESLAIRVVLCAWSSILLFTLLQHTILILNIFINAPQLSLVNAIIHIVSLLILSTNVFLKREQIVRKFGMAVDDKDDCKTLFLIIVIYSFVILGMAIYENDVLEYLAVAKQIKIDNSLVNYPYNDTNNFANLYAPSSHPPAFHSFLTLTCLGTVLGTFPLRLLNILSFITFLIIFRKYTNLRKFYSVVFVFLSIPLLINLMIGMHIDLPRLALYFVSIIFFERFLLQKKLDDLFIAWFLLVYFHSIGLLMAAISLCSLIFLIKKKIIMTKQTIIYVAPLVIASVQYVINTIQFGSPVQDSGTVLENPSLKWEDDLVVRRNLNGMNARLLQGALSPFTNIQNFGVFFVMVAFVAIVLFWRFKFLTPLEKFCFILVLTFFGVMVFFAVINQLTFVKNLRYVFSIFPFCAPLIGRILKELKNAKI